MNLILRTLLVTIITCGMASSSNADPWYRHRVKQHSRGGIPCYDYRTSEAQFVDSMTSELAVTTLVSNDETNKVDVVKSTFVSDNMQAGPLSIVDISGESRGGKILVTGRAIHNGGPTGSLLGGKCRVRLECLASTGTTAANSVIVAAKEFECWVRQNEPEAIYLQLKANAGTHTHIQDVDRIRLILEYHSSR